MAVAIEVARGDARKEDMLEAWTEAMVEERPASWWSALPRLLCKRKCFERHIAVPEREDCRVVES